MFKRVFDFCAAFLALILFSPVFFAVAILVKLTSPGPVLFKQKRLTQGAQEFTILKFRTMRTTFDRDARGVQVRGNSNAITPVGRFLRKTKLDELPQLINIVFGQMSFVGPRPELPRRLAHYSERDKMIFAVRSGISSPASIVLSNEEYLMNSVQNPEDFYIKKIMPYKIDVNIYYIQNQSFWGDMRIIFLTLAKLAWRFPDNVVVADAALLAGKKSLENCAARGGVE